MSLGMTKIYKFQDDISTDALKELKKHSSLAIDTEGSGLQIPHRDKLSLIQFSTGNNDAYIIQPNRKNYKAPNIVKILENEKITKIGHYLRYDVSGLEYFLKLIDLENSDVGPINIKKKINGKKIKSIEVLVKLED